MKEYIVYRHTSPNGKVYIGITCQLPCRRWARGKGYRNNWHFYNAIQKYGWDNFTHEVLYTGLSNEDAARIEADLIARHRSTEKQYGYNRDPGNGVRHEVSEETRRKLSESHKHLPHLSGEAHPQWGKRGPDSQNYGRRHTDEERALMRMNNTRKIPVICVEDGMEYVSATEAAEDKGTYCDSIIKCCKQVPHYNTAGGFHWRFADEQRHT